MPHFQKIPSGLLYATAVMLFLLFHGIGIEPPFSTLAKTIPTIILIHAVYRKLSRDQASMLCLILLMNALGDIFLDVDRKAHFLKGLISFLAAHLLYIAFFFRSMRFSLQNRAPELLAVITISLTLGALFFTMHNPMKVPVLLYLGIISVMNLVAMTNSSLDRRVGIGAFLFLCSDSIIAITTFFYPIAHSTMVSIPLYFIAQYVIIHSLIRSNGQESGGNSTTINEIA